MTDNLRITFPIRRRASFARASVLYMRAPAPRVRASHAVVAHAPLAAPDESFILTVKPVDFLREPVYPHGDRLSIMKL